MRVAFACLVMAGCGLTLDTTPPRDSSPGDSAFDAGVFDASRDAGMDAAADVGIDAPACETPMDCAMLNRGACQSFCIGGMCTLPDQDGDGVGPGCEIDVDCDDNDPTIGLDGVRPCDNGEMGVCAIGATQTCVDGVLGACEGGRESAPIESCNALDDDCDGRVDEGLRTEGPGFNMCEGSFVCRGGEWVTVAPGPRPAGDDCDGEDSDCDGAIDEDCPRDDCVFVRRVAGAFADIPSATNPGMGVRDIANALAAIRAGAPPRICLLAGTNSCTPAGFSVNTNIPAGVTIVGNLRYTLAGGVRRCRAGNFTNLQPEAPTGVNVSGGPATTAFLDLGIRMPGGEPVVQGLNVSDGANVVLDRVQIFPGGEGDPPVAVGVKVNPRGSLTAIATRIDPGFGDTVYGIEGLGRVELLNSCGTPTCAPSCGGGEGIRGGSPLDDGAAIFMDGGELVASTYAICQDQGSYGIDAVNNSSVVLLNSAVSVNGLDDTAFGVSTTDCEETWISNSQIRVGPSPESGADGYGVWVEGTCSAVITQNSEIVGATGGPVDTGTGVFCDANCLIDENPDIAGAASLALVGDGVLCNDRCVITNNTIRGSRPSASIGATIGLGIAPGSVAFVARNDIRGGCGLAQGVVSSGLVRLENNFVAGADCDRGVPEATGAVLETVPLFSANSNTFVSGIGGIDGDGCNALGAFIDGNDGRGRFRNNIFGGSPGCVVSAAVEADILPGIFTHNVLAWGPYLDGSVILFSGPELEGLDPAYVENTFPRFDEQIFASYPDDLHLWPGSPAIARGTPTGAPPRDFDGDPRDPVTPSVGADEP
ncbi:MAG: hypothetical protein AAGE52_09215 [Myxococcota bacterium]